MKLINNPFQNKTVKTAQPFYYETYLLDVTPMPCHSHDMHKALKYILVVDDSPTQRMVISTILEKHLGIKTLHAQNGQECLDILNTDKANHIRLITLDLKMPVMTGIETLPQITKNHPHIPVIVVTGEQDIDSASTAIKNGATDFFLKPINVDRIVASARNAIKISTLNEEVNFLKLQTDTTVYFSKLIGHSTTLRPYIKNAQKAAQSDVNVLISGETGVGKEIFAQSIHAESSRSQHPFIAVNCGAIPENLVESTLFGHEKGSFTGATHKTMGKFRAADGGTLFLDEVGELPLDVQVKLLRALQEQEIEPVGSTSSIKINVRIIAATNRNLHDEIDHQRFRKDLYFRLSVLPITLPNLQQRKEDIPELTQYFLQKYAHDSQTSLKKITASAVKKLFNHSWPGNIRELENTLKRAHILSDTDTIHDADIIFSSQSDALPNQSHTAYAMQPTDHIPIVDTNGDLLPLDQVEKLYLEKALQHHGNNMTKTAKEIGIAKSTLYRKINAF